MKNRFTCDSFNLIYVVICDKYKEEYIGETDKKTKLRDRVRVYRQHIQQPTRIPTIKSRRAFKCICQRRISDISFSPNAFTRYKFKMKL